MSIVEVVLGSLDEYPLLLTVEEAAGRKWKPFQMRAFIVSVSRASVLV